MNILCIGDIVGRPGRRFLKENLQQVINKFSIDFVVANGENVAGGLGITRETYEELLSYGVNVITLGNHTFSKKEIFEFINESQCLIRPANYPDSVPGKGFGLYKCKSLTIGVINLNGRVFMDSADCPFIKADTIINKISSKCDIIIVDFHAEATSEKIALGHYLDGRVGIVFGTHTHVPTADAKIFPNGTAFITDIGMTGPKNSVLGIENDIVIQKFLTSLPARFEVSKNDPEFSAIVVHFDSSLHPDSIKLISEKDIL